MYWTLLCYALLFSCVSSSLSLSLAPLRFCRFVCVFLQHFLIQWIHLVNSKTFILLSSTYMYTHAYIFEQIFPSILVCVFISINLENTRTGNFPEILFFRWSDTLFYLQAIWLKESTEKERRIQWCVCFYQVASIMVHKLNEYPNSLEVTLFIPVSTCRFWDYDFSFTLTIFRTKCSASFSFSFEELMFLC